jgi:hypothetical protein
MPCSNALIWLTIGAVGQSGREIIRALRVADAVFDPLDDLEEGG